MTNNDSDAPIPESTNAPVREKSRRRLLVGIVLLIALLAIVINGFSTHREKQRKAIADADWQARTVACPKCGNRFTPEDHKAPFLGAVSAGTAGGGAAGAAGGGWLGAGTGVAIGGVGAIPGWIVGVIGGGIGGGVVGGVGAAWYRDSQLKCPSCGEIFKNPKN